MSSPWESETQRTAWLKAREGLRLLGTGDYEGAATACTEAIEPDAQSCPLAARPVACRGL
jgi:hypothetical protein